jgi:predicted Rossmann fold flavoprotein
MMAAGRAAERGLRVLLLERGPRLGRKLLLTGGGRCNVTNAAPFESFLRAYGRKSGFLRRALSHFGGPDLREWLHARGVATVEEAEGRVFPASLAARSVLDALQEHLNSGGVDVVLQQRVREIVAGEGHIEVVVKGRAPYRARQVVIATGGASYPQTGSTGDGYDLARQVGHEVSPVYPAITALETQEDWPAQLQGTPLRAVTVRAVRGDGRSLARAQGDALWTHFGLSGPAVLDVSLAAVRALGAGHQVDLVLDLVPTESEDQLLEGFRRAADTRDRREVTTLLRQWLPRRTAHLLLRLVGVDARCRASHLSKPDRRRLVDSLKRLRIAVRGPRPIQEAIVTGGGIELSEIDAARMESRRLPGLHFAGEVLDVQGPSGGYNLQAALSTGFLAGSCASSGG